MFITKLHFKIGSTARDHHGPTLSIASQSTGHIQSGWISFNTPDGGINIDLSEVWKMEVIPPQEQHLPQGEA